MAQAIKRERLAMRVAKAKARFPQHPFEPEIEQRQGVLAVFFLRQKDPVVRLCQPLAGPLLAKWP